MTSCHISSNESTFCLLQYNSLFLLINKQTNKKTIFPPTDEYFLNLHSPVLPVSESAHEYQTDFSLINVHPCSLPTIFYARLLLPSGPWGVCFPGGRQGYTWASVSTIVTSPQCVRSNRGYQHNIIFSLLFPLFSSFCFHSQLKPLPTLQAVASRLRVSGKLTFPGTNLCPESNGSISVLNSQLFVVGFFFFFRFLIASYSPRVTAAVAS